MAVVPGINLNNSCNGNQCKIEIKIGLSDNRDEPRSGHLYSNDIQQSTSGILPYRQSEMRELGYRGQRPYERTTNNDTEYEESDADSGIENPSFPFFTDLFSRYRAKVKSTSKKGVKKKHIPMYLQHKKPNTFYKPFQRQVTNLFKKMKTPIEKKIINITRNSDVLAYVYHDGRQTGAQDPLLDERTRIDTFSDYRGNGNKILLAKYCFYHDHSNGPTFTICFLCNLNVSDWSQDDDVLSRHRRLSPECAFLTVIGQNAVTQRTSALAPSGHPRRTNYTNSAVLEAQRYVNVANEKLAMEHGRQESSTHGRDLQMSGLISARSYLSNSTQQTKASSESPIAQESGYNIPSTSGVSNGLDLTELNLQHWPNRSPNPVNASEDAGMCSYKHPDMSSFDSRMRTYNSWPGNTLQITPQQLSYAGFFYTGFGDLVRCFSCGIGLKDWKADDDPIERHTRWCPQCEHVKGITKEEGIPVERGNITPMAGQEGQQAGIIQDSVVTKVVESLQEMGFSSTSATEAVMAVTGETDLCDESVLVDYAVSWLFSQEENRLDQAEGGIPPAPRDTASSGPLRSPSTSSENHPEKSLKEENQMLKQIITCVKCMDQRADILFLPCRHLVCCDTCMSQMQRCPKCSQYIKDSVKTYMS